MRIVRFLIAVAVLQWCGAVQAQELIAGGRVNQKLLDFVRAHYAPGRILLTGSTGEVGMLFRTSLGGMTPDHYPSKWSHTALLGPLRDPNDSNSVVVYESTIRLYPRPWNLQNGAQESDLFESCTNDVDHACILEAPLSAGARDSLLAVAKRMANDTGPTHYRYPITGLVGTLWAMITRTVGAPNIFDDPTAMQCSSFVRLCFRNAGCEIISGATEFKHTSPETFFQSSRLAHLAEWAAEEENE